MNNDELLHALGDLLNKRFTEEREHTRQIVKEEIAANNKVIGTIVRAEIAAVKQEIVKLGEKINKRLNAQDKKMEEIKTAPHLSKN